MNRPQYVRGVIRHVYWGEDDYCGHNINLFEASGKEWFGMFQPTHDKESLIQMFSDLASLEGWTLDLDHSEFVAAHE